MKTLLLLILATAALSAPCVHAQIADASETGDSFGYAVATGDFNGDFVLDLAVGVPSEDLGSVADAGAVHVIYGTINTGLASARNQYWHQDSPWVQDVAEAGDQFGFALAGGDFNWDGYDDLAVGVPYESIGSEGDAGAVALFFGGAAGLTGDNQFWHQGVAGVEGDPAYLDLFGAALAAGDLNFDGYEDLAIGAPFDSDLGSDGAVNVLYGSPSGPTSTNDQLWSQNSPGVLSESYWLEEFGYALAIGDFDGDGFGDLAVGTPGELVGTVQVAGGVNVLYGSWSGLTSARNQLWHQESPGIHDRAERDDLFGLALAAGDFNADGRDDLAIGAPWESVGSVRGAGVVHALFGASGGLSAAGSQFWHQNIAGVIGNNNEDDEFGTALTSGDFDGDGFYDLAIGVPSEIAGGIADGGAVAVLYGAASGPTAADDQLWHQNSQGVLGTAVGNDSFGGALASGDFDGDGYSDLAVGVPYDYVGGFNGAGAANVLYGAPGAGLGEARDEYWHQNSTGPEPRTDDEIAEAADDTADTAGLAAAQPLAFALEPAAPNPFAASTRIAFALLEAGHVRLAVYDVLGREVGVLVDSRYEAGRHAVSFDGAGLPGGTYLVRLESGDGVQVQPITLLK